MNKCYNLWHKRIQTNDYSINMDICYKNAMVFFRYAMMKVEGDSNGNNSTPDYKIFR